MRCSPYICAPPMVACRWWLPSAVCVSQYVPCLPMNSFQRALQEAQALRRRLAQQQSSRAEEVADLQEQLNQASQWGRAARAAAAVRNS